MTMIKIRRRIYLRKASFRVLKLLLCALNVRDRGEGRWTAMGEMGAKKGSGKRKRTPFPPLATAPTISRNQFLNEILFNFTIDGWREKITREASRTLFPELFFFLFIHLRDSSHDCNLCKFSVWIIITSDSSAEFCLPINCLT